MKAAGRKQNKEQEAALDMVVSQYQALAHRIELLKEAPAGSEEAKELKFLTALLLKLERQIKIYA